LARLDESIAAFNQRFILNLWNQGSFQGALGAKKYYFNFGGIGKFFLQFGLVLHPTYVLTVL
jgi:hypothetical protein